MVNLVIAAAIAAVAVAQSVSGEVQKRCTDEEKSFILVRDGLKDFKSLNRAANKKLTFLAGTDDLGQARDVVKKYGKRSVAWDLSKDDLKEARKRRKSSKKLKKIIKKMIKSYKKATGKKLKMVTVPSSTSERIVKAFEKRKIVVVRPKRNLSKHSKVKKFLKKLHKAEKHDETVPGSIISFTVYEKNGPKQLKKLRRALSIVNAKKCFKKSKQQQSGSENEPEQSSGPILSGKNDDENPTKFNDDKDNESESESESESDSGSSVSSSSSESETQNQNKDNGTEEDQGQGDDEGNGEGLGNAGNGNNSDSDSDNENNGDGNSDNENGNRDSENEATGTGNASGEGQGAQTNQQQQGQDQQDQQQQQQQQQGNEDGAANPAGPVQGNAVQNAQEGNGSVNPADGVQNGNAVQNATGAANSADQSQNGNAVQNAQEPQNGSTVLNAQGAQGAQNGSVNQGLPIQDDAGQNASQSQNGADTSGVALNSANSANVVPPVVEPAPTQN